MSNVAHYYFMQECKRKERHHEASIRQYEIRIAELAKRVKAGNYSPHLFETQKKSLEREIEYHKSQIKKLKRFAI